MAEHYLHSELEALKQEAAKLQQEYAAASAYIATLQVLQDVTRSLSSELNLEPLLQMILGSAVQVMRASAGSLLLLDRETDELVFEVIEGGGGEALQGTRMPADQGIAGWVVSHREPLIVDDVNRDNRHYRRIAEDHDFAITSLLCVPLITKGQVIGSLQVLNEEPGKYFDTADQEILTTFAAQSAVAIENARLYNSLREEHERIIAVEEEVRRELARDLHDGPAQLLASIIMSANFVKEAIAHNAMEHAIKELGELMPVAEKALRQVRTLLFDLRPVILETQGVIPALESYAQRLREAEDLNVVFRASGEIGRLSHNAEVAIFSIVQEAITNAKKHAKASRIEIEVIPSHDQVTVAVRDNGVGFDVKATTDRYDERSSLGMLNMKERAEIVNGTLSLSSTPGQGTSILLELPLTTNLASESP
ncbi:MAG: GAF domain-containing sensor histidine kinase [Anaerolineales bacterium]|nr:MAG: GAF domain-containing sensor histidine kinase [Anaerolineales bacterium]